MRVRARTSRNLVPHPLYSQGTQSWKAFQHDAEQTRAARRTLRSGAVEDLLRLGMFCGPRLAALAGGDPVVVAPLAGAVAAGGEGSTIVCAFEAWSARQRVT